MKNRLATKPFPEYLGHSREVSLKRRRSHFNKCIFLYLNKYTKSEPQGGKLQILVRGGKHFSVNLMLLARKAWENVPNVGRWKGHFVALPWSQNGVALCGRFQCSPPNPAPQHRTILSVLPSAGTADRRNSCGVVGRQENRQNCSALLFLCLPLHPPLQPLHLQPDSQPPRTCRLGPFVCVVLSWEEVPSRLTLRKWFQSVLVWILAGFCNCQFPYQSVCISKGRSRATSPLFFLSSFVLREVLLPPLLLGLVGGYWRDEAVCRTWFVRDACVPVPVWGASVSVGSRA